MAEERETQGEIVDWFTARGNKIPIMEGESKEDALNRAFNKQNDKKDKDIKQAKKQAEDSSKQSVIPSKMNKVDEKSFSKSLSDAKDSRPETDKWRVDLHNENELKERGCKCFTSKGGSTVAVDKSGDIISVCKKSGDDTIKGKDLLAEAVKMGGRKLDSFSGNHDFYVKCGFEPVAYTPFNTQYAPDGWKSSGCGKEDVIFYKYVGVGKVKNTDLVKFLATGRKFTGDDGYDNAMKYRDSNL